MNFRIALVVDEQTKLPAHFQNSFYKVIFEKPTSYIQNMKFIYGQMSNHQYSNFPDALKNLLFKIVCFHSFVIQRRKYVPLGWTSHYDWGLHDLQAAFSLLEVTL